MPSQNQVMCTPYVHICQRIRELFRCTWQVLKFSLSANRSIPSSYIHALECFVAAKQEFAERSPRATMSHSVQYDYQRKYINALIKQLPPGTVYPAASRSVIIHPPTTIKNQPLRQGPFLLQPSPRVLEESDGGNATDIAYLTFGDGGDDEDEIATAEYLGVVLMAFQDGKVDVCLDVEKVEATWEIKQVNCYPRCDLMLFILVQSSSQSVIYQCSQSMRPLTWDWCQ
jgi:nucleoporin NUP82